MNKKSFTLIELLVVIAIIGILSSLVIARFSDWGDNARIANTLQWSAGVHRTLGANLVGHWPLNGNANDISGYGNHGTMHSFEEGCWVDGVSGTGSQGLEFDGSNYVTTTKNFDYSKDFTASVWVKRNVRDIWHNAVQFAFYYPYLISSHDNNKIAGGYLKEGGSSSVIYCDVDPYIHVFEWFHIVVVKENIPEEGTYFSAYINGSLSRRAIMTDIDDNQNGLLSIGGGASTARRWNGLISDVRIYDTAFTAEEVSRIYAEIKDSYLVYE